MRLKEKIILVTGSTMGIGRAIAKRCVEEGARVIIHGLEKEYGEKVVEEIGTDKAVLYVGDLAEDGAAESLVEFSTKSYGKLDALVNNAAMVVTSNIDTTDKNFLQKVLSVNTIAPLLLIKAALPHLSNSNGNVLNIGSVNAWCGEPNLLDYSISKGGLMTMTRNLGDTLFRDYGVRVNQINPGWVLTETEIERKKDHGLSDKWYESIPKMYAPSGRIIWPKEIAAAAVFWLSEECGPITGQVMELEQYPMIGRNAPKDTSTIQ